MASSKWLVWAIVGIVAIGAIVALAARGSDGGVADPARVRELQAEGARVIDVRTAGEYATSHIPGSENVPLDQLEDVAAGWNRGEPLVVYCAVGDRSASAAELLQSMGFSAVWDLGGGIAGWDGDVEKGEALAVTPPPASSGLPVLYEFYTDW